MKEKELISVIVPTCGRSDTLDRALESIERQTYKNLEIIVVDDNVGNEETREKVRSIVSKHSVKLIMNKKRMGGGGSRNEGIRRAKGKFVVFLDDDDEMLPTKIEKQYHLYKKLGDDRVGMIYCYAEYIFPNEKKVVKVDYEGIPLKEHLMVCIAATSWWFCPKAVLNDIGGFVDLPNHQDAITLFNMMEAGYKVYRVPEVLLKYYAPDGNSITKTSNEWIDVDRYYMKLYDEISDSFSKKDDKDIRYKFYRRMASYDYILGNKKKLFSEAFQMVLRYPFRVDTMKAITKCFLVLFRGKNNG